MSNVVFIGRPPGSVVDGVTALGEDVLEVCVYNKTTQHLWLRRIGARRGKNTGDAAIDYRYVAYLGTSSHVPDARLGYVGLKTTNVVMTSASEGADVDHALDVVDGQASNKAAQVWSNSYVGLGVEQDTPGTLRVGMRVYATLPEPKPDDVTFYKKTSVDVPPDPFGSYTNLGTQGHLAMWAECDTNDAPEVPINRTADTSTGDLTPTLKADFRDRNGAYGPSQGDFDDGDLLSRVHIQVLRSSDNVTFWDTAYDATTSEQNANQSSRIYAGTTLIRGVEVKWRIRHRDMFNAWGDWSSFLPYTPPATGTGSVTINSGHTPVGKQDAVNGFTFQFIWNHNTGLSTNGIIARFKKNGSIIQENGLWKADTTAAGATGTITYTELGFGDLDWGGSYTVALKGRDTNNVQSNWSNEHQFTTDKAPTVPGALKPTGGLTHTAFPLLQAAWNDADDTTGTGLTGTFEITRPDNSVISVTPTFNGTSGYWEFQTTGTQITMVGVYKWRARSFDGTLYSGDVTVAGNAEWSLTSIFSYQTSGPSLTITAPLQDATILTATPTVTWTQSGQAKYRVWVTETGSAQAIYDTGFITDSVTTSHTIAGGILALGEFYDFYVSLRDISEVQTDAANYNVELDYIAPSDVSGFNAQPVSVYTDPGPTAIRFEWEQSSESDDDFKAYDLYRDGVLIQRITSKLVLAAYDLRPHSGIEHEYVLKTITLNTNGAEISSVGVTTFASVTLPGYVLVSVANPLTNRAILTRVYEDSSHPVVPGQTYLPWGAITDPDTAPTTIFGKARYQSKTVTAKLVTDEAALGTQRYKELYALIVSGETFSLRDDLGNEWFMIVPPEEQSDFGRLRLSRYDIVLPMRQENFTAGVVVAS